MRIELGEATLRDWRPDDAPALARHANSRAIADQLRDAFPHPYSLSDAKSFLSRVTEVSPRTVFAIDVGGEPVGSIGVMIGRDVHRFTAELGYWLAEAHWGRGIMTRAVVALTEYAFATFGLHRIHADPFATNPASARVLEKAGYVLEARLRASAYKNGVDVDQWIYATVRTP